MKKILINNKNMARLHAQMFKPFCKKGLIFLCNISHGGKYV